MFRDYFLRFNKLRTLAVSCPDIMFYMRGTTKASAFNTNIDCLWHESTTSTGSISPTENNCRLLARRQVPRVYVEKASAIRPAARISSRSWFKIRLTSSWSSAFSAEKRGYTVANPYPGRCRQFNHNVSECRKFAFQTRIWRIDIWDNTPSSVSKWLQRHRFEPTKIPIVDRWVNSLTNPGLCAGNYFTFWGIEARWAQVILTIARCVMDTTPNAPNPGLRLSRFSWSRREYRYNIQFTYPSRDQLLSNNYIKRCKLGCRTHTFRYIFWGNCFFRWYTWWHQAVKCFPIVKCIQKHEFYRGCYSAIEMQSTQNNIAAKAKRIILIVLITIYPRCSGYINGEPTVPLGGAVTQLGAKVLH